MKKITILLFALLISINAIGQKKFNYENPHFEFENIKGNSSDLKKITGYNPKLLTQVDLSKINFKKSATKVDGFQYYYEVPFYVNKKIDSENDFIFALFGNVSWSILNQKKKPIVKSFDKIKNDKQKTVGTIQQNKNLKEPISLPGKYYIGFYINKIPTTQKIVYIYLGMLSDE